ncbi:anti-sigma regulatory factor, serine/threonine protein kinase [Amycolatopsis mediterranei S699]|uniref:Anti-sigma regulatory factor, serine/threonine protein kinase n=2 Tax=Amycolatopsis mediterranei TaxID=33910 RepID=A0A9R0UBA8_AMYMS|nr:ATP-binding protein [Amycolatopsis mediterranei]ADJ47634.1 putative anti-sigma regulatory factor, serine/threonine protein kinase [Amycolatopsis mediterranei U32]AEK44518.1 anti-sigma regulatory factor, serine/threonine protein kinase [Amycolatopsis mediterranei S699]AFO79345.1 anti-sigma regulatory factor, serine/threonine protein kinase [Amycolatopsis mediterranei S699]AGT86473.1 anti-sigma regulatory factor, serine/threonine protein kinase [Amycolatopsis mediterranei RB]KDO11923.1 anti-s
MTDPLPPGAPALPVSFHQRTAAIAERLPALRAALARWLATLSRFDVRLSVERREDIVLAGYEAMANSAEHAYPHGEAGPVDVRAEAQPGRLTVTVTDYGTWRPPAASDGLRGRGLLLIDTLADHSAQVHRDDGTTVTMTWLTG